MLISCWRRPSNGIAVASFADAELLGEDVIREIEEELWEIAHGLGAISLLLSFGRVRLMSTALLGVLIVFSRRFEKMGGRLKLCEVTPALARSFALRATIVSSTSTPTRCGRSTPSNIPTTMRPNEEEMHAGPEQEGRAVDPDRRRHSFDRRRHQGKTDATRHRRTPRPRDPER